MLLVLPLLLPAAQFNINSSAQAQPLGSFDLDMAHIQPSRPAFVRTMPNFASIKEASDARLAAEKRTCEKKGGHLEGLRCVLPPPPPVYTPQAPIVVPAASGDVVGLIVKWANYYGVDSNWLLRVGRCESRLNPYSVASNIIDGGHPTGLFQHVSTYWAGRAARYGVLGASIFDANAQARVTAGMFRDGQAYQWACK